MKARKGWADIVIAEDDPDDCLLLREAFEEARITAEIHFVADGEELLDYLRAASGRPHLILLDLNMPRTDGREALAEIKRDAVLGCIPVVVLTTSNSDSEIARCYRLGANSYLVKPDSFTQLVEMVKAVHHYWLRLVRLPIQGQVDDRDE